MNLSLSANNALATDINSLNSLKSQANANNPQAAREAAKQLESLFMHEMIKSMRQATMKSGLLDNDSSKLADSMMDQQLSVSMAGMPGGLADAITAQIARSMGIDPSEAGVNPAAALGGTERNFSIPSTVSFAGRTPRYPGLSGNSGVGSTAFLDAYAPSPKGRDNFVQAHSSAAERVARDSGIPASYMLGQAGHETGWGKSEIRGDNGSNSFNLFGIKATGNWKGKVAEITTTEYVDGIPRKVKAKFRAYDSYEDSFRDYARLITENPRYAQAVESTGNAKAYATALQNAGYATDPLYASKLSRAIESARAAQQGTQG
ncbi:flagellar assembly peptidoglycan hydrolase FlgJ [Comamonas aquatica]|uniref:flagellar assembly peptidoglycan hydrolase FlgJ n=1 Tax=Comamonas aquatica TaxID=225991 RepID=UPI0005A6889B|nr:flagellar assembly peptidoglycan hydrolase FlgJ [Comamonas aquatica]